MKAILSFTILALFLLGMSGCNTAVSMTPCIAPRGTWHDHIYVNEFMGFQFELPETWYIYTEEERAAFIGIITDFAYGSFDDVLSPNIAFNMQDMRAEDIITGNSVSVDVQTLFLDENLLNGHEYLQKMVLYMPEFDVGVSHSNIQIGANPRQLWDVEWYYMLSEVTDAFGRNAVQARFVNIQDGFLRTIMISVGTGGVETIDEIWEYFSEIDTQFFNATGIIPTIRNAPNTASRGLWDDNVYINPSLNLRFTIPEQFQFFSENELAASMNVPVALLYGDVISAELWTEVIQNRNTVHAVGIHGPLNDGHVFVDFFVRSMPRGIQTFPTQQYLQHLLNLEMRLWQDAGENVRNESLLIGKKEIAGHQWYSGGFVVDLFDGHDSYYAGINMYMTIVDNHIWRLQIDIGGEDVLEDTLAMFSTVGS